MHVRASHVIHRSVSLVCVFGDFLFDVQENNTSLKTGAEFSCYCVCKCQSTEEEEKAFGPFVYCTFLSSRHLGRCGCQHCDVCGLVLVAGSSWSLFSAPVTGSRSLWCEAALVWRGDVALP